MQRPVIPMETFKIQQTGSPIRRARSQRQTLVGLGLNHMGRTVDVPNTPETWGMIRKVRHLVRIVDQDLFEAHRLECPRPWQEESDAILLQQRIFAPRRLRLQRFKKEEMNNKTPDFRVLKDGVIRGYCEMKSPQDSWIYQTPSGLNPGEFVERAREGRAAAILGDFILKAAQQFDAANPEHELPNILAFVNHAPGKDPIDLRLALEGKAVPGGGHGWFIFDDPYEPAPADKQKRVWEAAHKIDLFLWVDSKTDNWVPRFPVGAKRLNEARELLGLTQPCLPKSSTR
jgi:large subunit ribosomal protein L30